MTGTPPSRLAASLAAVIGAERFLAESRTTANLQHPHTLPLFDSGVADGFLFYVMPFVEGVSLRGRLSRGKQLPIPEALRITTEVGDALVPGGDVRSNWRSPPRDVRRDGLASVPRRGGRGWVGELRMWARVALGRRAR